MNIRKYRALYALRWILLVVQCLIASSECFQIGSFGDKQIQLQLHINSNSKSNERQGCCLRTQSLESTSSSLRQTSKKIEFVEPSMNSVPLSAWEARCQSQIKIWYRQSSSLKCPFWKRRFADALDQLHQIMRFLSIRHKSLDVWGPPPGCEGLTASSSSATTKYLDLSLQERLALLKSDWKTTTNKGYYITGRLSSGLYQDDCFFEGPDPDMPVKGLRKYLHASSQLFDSKQSTAILRSIEILPNQDATQRYVHIQACWELSGVLQLPWKPTLPTWSGTTTYWLDSENHYLIDRHVETWDISVWQAFGETLLPPSLSTKIWRSQ